MSQYLIVLISERKTALSACTWAKARLDACLCTHLSASNRPQTLRSIKEVSEAVLRQGHLLASVNCFY